MPDDVIELMNQIETEIRNDDYSGATETLEKLESRYEQSESEEKVLYTRSITARDEIGSLSQRDRATLDEYAQGYTGIMVSRASFLFGVTSYLTAPSETNPTETLSLVDQTRTNEREFAKKRSAARSTVGDLRLPAAIAIITASGPDDPVPKETESPVTATVQNVGDATASGVTLSIDSSPPLEFEPGSVSLGVLDPDEQESGRFDATAGTAGVVDVELRCSSDNSGEDTAEVSFEVVDKTELADRSATGLEGLIESVEEAEIPKRRKTPLAKNLNGASRKVRRGTGKLPGNVEAANAQFTAASKQVGAFLNVLNGPSNGPPSDLIPDALKFTWEQQAESVINQLASAIEARV